MTKSRHRGFTLIELIIFIVVVAAGLAGILSVMNTVVKSSADPMVNKQSIAIAESLLEEILLKDYVAASPCPAASGTRAQWDDICDYNGYTSTGVVDMMGSASAGLALYNIAPAVKVESTSALTGVEAKKITVSVTGPGGTISLSGFRSNY